MLEEGPGWRYLIQHSAGSGKTASIGWSSHLLADLHDGANRKVFDTVLVVSDRSVIDTQLQETLENFERRKGVVASITSEKGIKSEQLAAALSGDKLKQVLSAAEVADLADGGEVDIETLLAAQMGAQTREAGITYGAFTATPKAKTLELFGRRPNPNEPAGPGNKPAPFHVNSMRQPIEEGFILDVLQNYTSYKVAFQLAQDGHSLSTEEVERSAALKMLMGWVKLHPHNIAQKVQIVVELFRQFVWPLLEGKAKAMVVVGSRKEAVRWKLAIDTYIKEQGYPLGTLVAFKTYFATAELAEATDPNLILDLKTKLDAQGHYDEFEIDRVVKVLLEDALSDKVRQKHLFGAIEPVAQRLMMLHKEARLAFRHADEINDGETSKRAKEELDALTLFRSDMGTYGRFYTFLSQIFDYANTGFEKRAMFYKALLPLLEFEREINTLDLSKLVLTHHHIRELGSKKLDLQQGESMAIPGMAPGGGGVKEKDKVELAEIIAKVIDVRTLIRGRLMQSETLREQAAANSKEQFANSPDFGTELLDAIIGALDTHKAMSSQALNSPEVQDGIKTILLNHTNLYEDLRDQANENEP